MISICIRKFFSDILLFARVFLTGGPITLLSICLFHHSAHAFNPFSSKLKLYQCNSREDAVQCQRCKAFSRENGIDSIDFKIDPATSKVITQTYLGHAIVRSKVEDFCTVVDRRNWICGEGGKFDDSGNYSFIQSGMNNGVFFKIGEFRYVGLPKLNISANESKSFQCAK